jgi:probable F420-dependent oxidoreductase
VRDDLSMTEDMRVGVLLQPQHTDYVGLRRAWSEAEQLGVDSIFTWDHFFPIYGDPDGTQLECLALLAAMAEVTERVRIGTLVMCNSYRNPHYAAYALGTIDQISGGRVIAGLGAGWFARDYREFGYEFGRAGSRLDALARDLPEFKRRRATLNPPPTGGLPILIGGGGERRTIRIVAEHADIWHAFGDADEFRRKDEILRRHCAELGRDPAAIERAWAIFPDELERAESLRAAGVRHLIIGFDGDGHGYDLAPLRELVRWRDALA